MKIIERYVWRGYWRTLFYTTSELHHHQQFLPLEVMKNSQYNTVTAIIATGNMDGKELQDENDHNYFVVNHNTNTNTNTNIKISRRMVVNAPKINYDSCGWEISNGNGCRMQAASLFTIYVHHHTYNPWFCTDCQIL